MPERSKEDGPAGEATAKRPSTMRRDLAIGLVIGALIFAAMMGSHLIGSRATPSGQAALAGLDQDLSPLVERFNAARDSTRLVVLLSPT